MAWIGRILGWVFAAIAAVLGLGAAFEAWMDFKARDFEPAGRMIAMGGARQHIHCLGAGRPTVILEAGAYSHSVNWALLHPQIAATHRVCAYDRPGLGWSEARPGPTDGPTRMRQLRALLDAADEKGPFVLVGHSYGGVLARAFLREFPSDIVGLVAVDSASPGQSAQFADAQIALAPWVLVSEFLPPFAAHFGAFRYYDRQVYAPSYPDLPGDGLEELLHFGSDSRHRAASAAELGQAFDSSWASALPDGPAVLGDLPLAVVSQGRSPRAWYADEASHQNSERLWAKLQARVATLSTDSLHVTVPGADHNSLLGDRRHAAQTLEAIRHVLVRAEARMGDA